MCLTIANQQNEFGTFSMKFILIEKEENEDARRNLTMRFDNASTVPGTRNFYQFIPRDRNKIVMKQVSFMKLIFKKIVTKKIKQRKTNKKHFFQVHPYI